MIQEKEELDELVYSRLGDDPDMADILDMFIDEIPSRMTAMLEQYNQGNWEGLRRLAHQLKGAAGSYGFDGVSPYAQRLERTILDGEPRQQIHDALMELVELSSRIRRGRPV
jgi:HPt (histidine-containing phosphotransfer) domain-containing protein